MLFLFLCFLARSAYGLEDLIIVYSDYTPSSLIHQFSKNSKTVYVLDQTRPTPTFCDQASIIIDITLKLSYLTFLEDLAEYCSCIYLTITPNPVETYSKNRYYVHGSSELEKDGLLNLISHFEVKKFSLISSNSITDLVLFDTIEKAVSDQLLSSIVYDPKFILNNIEIQVKRFIKTKGVKKIVILGEGPSLKAIQNELNSQNLIVYGNFFIIGSKGIYSASIEGALILAEPGTEQATSYETYEFLSISSVLQKIIKFAKNNNELNRLCPNHYCTNSYNIINIINSTKKIVGSFSETLNFTESIVYPGNNKDSDALLTKTKLVISLANGTSEIYNQGYVPTFAYWYQGAHYALRLSNIQQEIEGFEFEFFPTNCGNFMYDPIWYNMCFSQLANKLGLAYMTSIWYEGSLGNLLTLKNLAGFIPQISPLSQDNRLESKEKYPEFVKMSLSNNNLYVIGFSFYFINKWSSLVLFASDDTYYSQYLEVVAYVKKFGISLMNPMDKQVFPSNYTRDQFDQYRDYFEGAKNSKCRVYLVYSSVTRYILEGLYDVGIYKDDIILIGDAGLLTLLKNSVGHEEYHYKIKDYLINSFAIKVREYSGSYGMQVKSQLEQVFPSIDYLGITFDTFIAVKDSLKYIIEKGDDYEDKYILMSTLRNIKTTGLGGSISFDPDTNNRANLRYIYSQIIQNDTTGEYEYVEKILIDKYGMNSYILIDQIVWPGGSTEVPSDIIKNGDCPFRDFQVQESEKGLKVLYIICAVLFIIVFLTSIISYKFFKSFYKELSEPKNMSLSDYGFYFYFYIEFFQLLSMGPDQDTYKFLVNNFEVFLSFEFALYYKIDGDEFWYLFYATVSLAVVFFFSALGIGFRNLIQESNIGQKVLFLSESLILLSHFMYLPLISMLLNIYNCRESIGSGLDSSFLARDCTTFCYKGTHLKWAIGSGFILTCMTISVTFFRPYTEEMQESLNIRTKPLYIQILSIFQVFIIVINKSLKNTNQSTTGYIQFGAIIILIFLTIFMKPYNYSKAYVGQVTALSMAAWGILISSIFIGTDYFIIWIVFEFTGLLIILVIGFIVIKTRPTMLVNEKSEYSIDDLFKFQFFGKAEILYKVVGSNSIGSFK